MSKPDIRRENMAAVFSALGDPTRLGLIAKLRTEEDLPLVALAEGSPLTRQGLTRHLQVLEGAGVVESRRVGRERHFRLNPAPFRDMQDYLQSVSAHWDDALLRLKSFVEE